MKEEINHLKFLHIKILFEDEQIEEGKYLPIEVGQRIDRAIYSIMKSLIKDMGSFKYIISSYVDNIIVYDEPLNEYRLKEFLIEEIVRELTKELSDLNLTIFIDTKDMGFLSKEKLKEFEKKSLKDPVPSLFSSKELDYLDCGFVITKNETISIKKFLKKI